MIDTILKLFGSGVGDAVGGVAKAGSDAYIANLILGKGFPAALALGALYYLSKLTYRNFSQAEDNADFKLFRAGYMLQDGAKVVAGLMALGAGIYNVFLK